MRDANIVVLCRQSRWKYTRLNAIFPTKLQGRFAISAAVNANNNGWYEKSFATKIPAIKFWFDRPALTLRAIHELLLKSIIVCNCIKFVAYTLMTALFLVIYWSVKQLIIINYQVFALYSRFYCAFRLFHFDNWKTAQSYFPIRATSMRACILLSHRRKSCWSKRSKTRKLPWKLLGGLVRERATILICAWHLRTLWHSRFETGRQVRASVLEFHMEFNIATRGYTRKRDRDYKRKGMRLEPCQRRKKEKDWGSSGRAREKGEERTEKRRGARI